MSIESAPITFRGAVVTLFISFLILVIGAIGLDFDLKVLLMSISIFTASVFVIYYDLDWNELLENGVIPILSKGMRPIFILLVVGMLIAAWMISGTIPYLMYIGLQIINPAIFLVATTILLSIASLFTGTSFGSIATFGVVMIGIAEIIGMPLPPTAGAIVVGGFFGDKLSPISDTTVLAAAVAGSDLMDHVYSMLYTTVPGYILTLILMYYIGGQTTSGTANVQNIDMILQAIQETFYLSPILLMPPAVLFILAFKKYPTIPVMWIAILVSVPIAIYQGFNFTEIATALASGPEITTSVDTLNTLFARGGIESMTDIVAVLLLAFLFAGQLRYARVFEMISLVLREKFIKGSQGRLILSTSFAGLGTGLGTGNLYLSEILPGVMYGDTYDELGIDRSVLSRTLEDSGTVVHPLIPWSGAALFVSGVLGVPTLAYAPWAIMCYTSFIFAWIYAYADVFIFKLGSDSDETTPKEARPQNQD